MITVEKLNFTSHGYSKGKYKVSINFGLNLFAIEDTNDAEEYNDKQYNEFQNFLSSNFKKHELKNIDAEYSTEEAVFFDGYDQQEEQVEFIDEENNAYYKNLHIYVERNVKTIWHLPLEVLMLEKFVSKFIQKYSEYNSEYHKKRFKNKREAKKDLINALNNNLKNVRTDE